MKEFVSEDEITGMGDFKHYDWIDSELYEEMDEALRNKEQPEHLEGIGERYTQTLRDEYWA